MPKNADPGFYQRANAHINLANEQLQQDIHGKVSASFAYGAARFATSLCASGYAKREDMVAHRKDNIDYFVREFRLALEEHMDDYIEHFDQYMKLSKQ